MQSSTVTYLNNQIKGILDTTFSMVSVHGEISNLVNHASGHSYFALKDAHSTIKCVLFKGNKAHIKIHLENGQKVVIGGGLNVYSPRGEYQILCHQIELFGKGDLYARFEALKAELKTQGYFDASRKKPLPDFANTIALVTSKSGAVIQDMHKVAAKRWPLIDLCLIDVAVQGMHAPEAIAAGIKKAVTLNPDVIVIARGGGSLEDLWAFNERIVAQAVFDSPIPIVSAIGHESDVVLSDFVADKRAPTPSAAMEMLLPDAQDYAQRLDDYHDRYVQVMNQYLHTKQNQLNELKTRTRALALRGQFAHHNEELTLLKQTYHKRLKYILHTKAQALPDLSKLYKNLMQKRFLKATQDLQTCQKALISHNPTRPTTSGKAKVFKGTKMIALSDLCANDDFLLEDAKCRLSAKAISKSSL